MLEPSLFLGFGRRTMMRYALEREPDRGSAPAVPIELPERGDVPFGALP